MLINLKDIIEIIKILSILLLSSFALYLPLYALLKNKFSALQLTIPVSISTQIIFGYIFYCFAKTTSYPSYYLIGILLINVLALSIIKPSLKLAKFKPNWGAIIIIILVLTAMLYHFFYDAFSSFAPGTIDTIAHINFIFIDLDKYGFLSFPSYPPGFHILLYPLTIVSSQIPVYRFTGPLIGLLTLASVILVYKDIFKHKISQAALIGILLLPVFNQLTLQLIGFFSTALSFIYITFLLFIILEKNISTKIKTVLLFIVLVGIALTIPYLSVQLIPCLVILSIFSFFNYKAKQPNVHRTIILTTLILIFSFLVAFGHVYLQSSVLKRTTGFPTIDMVDAGKDGLIIKNNYQKESDFIEHLPRVLQRIARTSIAQNYALPMLFTGEDIIKIKNVREFKGALSIGAYGLIFIALTIAILKRKEINLAVLSIFVIVFGVSVQTGILEMSTYRGRSGFYMLFFSVLLITSLIDHYYKSKYQKPLIGVIAILIASSFIAPPRYYRDYYTEYFEVAQRILRENQGKKILLKTSRLNLSSISSRITTEPLSDVMDMKKCDHDTCFVILEKNYLWIDPILSQRSYAADKGAVSFNKWQESNEEQQSELLVSIKKSSGISNYEKYWEDENIEVLRFNASYK